MESPGPQACQPNTLCTEELQVRCLPVWRWNPLILRILTCTLHERCLPVWRLKLQVRRQVSLTISVQRGMPASVWKTYRIAAFLSGDGISCQPNTLCTEELHVIFLGALRRYSAMISPKSSSS
jgi:hypothetical protein